MYQVGDFINWQHPEDGRETTVEIISLDVAENGQPIAVNVEGVDFKDGCAIGRLESDGSGLK
jgi:hypothetical protein